MPVLDHRRAPVVQAPMAGGTSTPALAAAVSGAGGLGFLAAGYKRADAVRAEIDDLRRRTAEPFGVNVFVPTPEPADSAACAAYVARLRPEAERLGVALGAPRFEDDDWEAKLALVAEAGVSVVSFTFGCPPADAVRALHDAGSEVWVTVTETREARAAEAAGADALVAQGIEAGAHQGSFAGGGPREELGLLALLQLLAPATGVPLVASGGIATGAAIAAVLCAGAHAAQLGTAFMRCPEAGTPPAHRAALAEPAPTRLTRAFTGRRARGIVNRFMDAHGAAAPVAYPEIHHVTAPLRAAARETGDRELMHLWAGQTHELARELPASELVERLAAETVAALRRAQAHA